MLYIIPTPIGNLEDITLRALRLLKEADLILAEDTRVTAKLLQHYQISRPMRANHNHNEHGVLATLIADLKSGKKIALVSDAGTPGISDPGFLLVRECVREGIYVECLPGPTAFIPALVQSGLPADRFFFEGFLPHKKGRETRLRYLATQPHTIVLYESPFRVVKTLGQLRQFFGDDRPACLCRELTKLYEETARGTLAELYTKFAAQKEVKGEIVILIAPPPKPTSDDSKYQEQD